MRHTNLVSFAVLVVVSFTLPSVGSLVQGADAGTGRDAPDVRPAALAIEYGMFDGILAGNDSDWYRVESYSSSPVCVSTSVTTDHAAVESLQLTRADGGSLTIPLTLSAGVADIAGLAAPSMSRATLGLSQTSPLSNVYDFQFAATTVPEAGLGDALTSEDAGATSDAALPVDPGCVGGRLETVLGIVDEIDLYSLQVAAGETLYYSVAATGPVTLQLLDTNSQVVGNVIGSGEAAGFYAPDGGTFYLAAQRSSPTTNVGYLVGVAAGPDPGNGCRPYCFISQ